MLAYFWGEREFEERWCLFPSVSFLGPNPAPTKGNECFAIVYSGNSPMISEGFEVFKSKLKYRAFSETEGGGKKNQNKTQSNQKNLALAAGKKPNQNKKELK